MAVRQNFDITLGEVKLPAGYGRLVAVIRTGKDTRELWFQHTEEPDVVRAARVNMKTCMYQGTWHIYTKGVRNRS